MQILQINSSARTTGSRSTQLADAISAALHATHTEARLQVRDLAREPIPALDEQALQALFTAPSERSPEQAARVNLNDALIAEIQAANALVLGVPMYNFGVPAALKNWIDAIARAQVTFRYTENGPQGLLTGKTVYVALARGGIHAGTPGDTQVPYLKSVLAFLGMTDVRFIYAEGLDLGAESERAGLQSAKGQIEEAIALEQPSLA
ncbi:MAG: FMN-dependent NADH-azoreductase [Burkholderiaceae bacterium]